MRYLPTLDHAQVSQYVFGIVDTAAVVLALVKLQCEFLRTSLQLGGNLKLLIEVLLELTYRARFGLDARMESSPSRQWFSITAAGMGMM